MTEVEKGFCPIVPAIFNKIGRALSALYGADVKYNGIYLLSFLCFKTLVSTCYRREVFSYPLVYVMSFLYTGCPNVSAIRDIL